MRKIAMLLFLVCLTGCARQAEPLTQYTNEVDELLGADTSLQDATAQGDPNSAWDDATNFFPSDNNYAYSCDVGFLHDVYNYGFSVPAGATIDGIIVNVEALADDPGETSVLEIELSWDGGSSYTSQNKQNSFTNSESIETYGGLSDEWGRTWASTEFSNANFRVRVEEISSSGASCPNVDNIQAQIYYTEAVVPTNDIQATSTVEMTDNATISFTNNAIINIR